MGTAEPAGPADPWTHAPETLSPAVAALFDDLVRQGIDLRVREADEMFHVFYWGQEADRDRALAMYFSSGRSLWATTEAVLRWRFGDLGAISRLLDFASGYGRMTRFLVTGIAAERVWVADLQADAVATQREQFGVHGVVSTTVPEELALGSEDGPFDAILVSSLFTHLPAATFRGWLARLGRLLSPRGVLLFSVHDVSLLGPEAAGRPFVFRGSSESGRLDPGDYGSTWVDEAFVRRTLQELLGPVSVHRTARGFANLQDLYVVVPEPAADWSGLHLPRRLDGFVESVEVDGEQVLRVSGWLADRLTLQAPQALELSVGGKRLATVDGADLAPRKDVQRIFAGEEVPAWHYRLAGSLGTGWDPGAELVLEARLPDGGSSVLLARTVAEALLYSARFSRWWQEGEHRRQEAAAAAAASAAADAAAVRERELLAALAASEESRAKLATRVAAIEASRFWKLRDRWFAVKRALGLTDER